jgi:hypothetical protein
MDTPQTPPMPKKVCMVQLMFPIDNDKDALDVKQQIDAVIKDIKDKRFTFQIIES